MPVWWRCFFKSVGWWASPKAICTGDEWEGRGQLLSLPPPRIDGTSLKNKRSVSGGEGGDFFMGPSGMREGSTKALGLSALPSRAYIRLFWGEGALPLTGGGTRALFSRPDSRPPVAAQMSYSGFDLLMTGSVSI